MGDQGTGARLKLRSVFAGDNPLPLAVIDGDPNRCIWHVASYMYVPEEFRDAVRAEPIVVDTPGSYKYFEALQQDYEQMPRQQKGLRNDRLDHMSLVKEEVVIAHFHSVVDRYMAQTTSR